MPEIKYRTIQVSDELYNEITELLEVTAKKSGITRITRPQLLEMMIKRFKEA